MSTWCRSVSLGASRAVLLRAHQQTVTPLQQVCVRRMSEGKKEKGAGGGGGGGGRTFETLEVTRPAEWVARVELNRPSKSNAMNKAMWREIRECFEDLSVDSDCRVVVLTGAGKNFTAGLDVMDHTDLFAERSSDVARNSVQIQRFIKAYQKSFTAVEKCPKPVIAAVHAACVGGGVDLVTACDIRLCSSDAWFQIKEVELGLAADVGTLQRLPKAVGNDSLVRELVYTARRLESREAERLGLVSGVYQDREKLLEAALDLAGLIASRSPVAVQGSKVNLNYSRDHSVDEALEFMSVWNMGMLQSEDLLRAAQALMQKEKPVFSKL